MIAGDMNLKIGRDRLDGFRKGAQDCGLELKEEDIPKDNLVNKFVNWFRIGKDAD